jgi:transposase
MPYTTNKNMPRIRREAVQLSIMRGWSVRKVARHLGFHHTAVLKWIQKAKVIGNHPIPTRSSRPKHHPKELSEDIIKNIVEKRLAHNRYAEAVHKELENDGIKVSLSSVKRTLERRYLIKKRSPWKRYHPHQDRPYPLKSGDLVQTDTIHLMISEKKRMYVFTLIDVYSRWVYAKAYQKINGRVSVSFIKEAQKYSSFKFNTLQSDHGPEFGMWFVSQIKKNHRYIEFTK